MSLTEILDDARSMSLFAPQRVIWVSSAEAALPRGRAVSSEESSAAAGIAAYHAGSNAGNRPGI